MQAVRQQEESWASFLIIKPGLQMTLMTLLIQIAYACAQSNPSQPGAAAVHKDFGGTTSSSGGTEASGFAAGFGEVIYNFDLGRQHRVGNQVGDFVSGMNLCGGVAQIFNQHANLTAITCVNDASGQRQAPRRHR